MENQLYLLYGDDTYLIKSKTKTIIDQCDVDEFNVTVYDADETDIEVAINDASTIPFMAETKVIIIKNCFFLTSKKDTSKINHNLDALKRYIDHPSDDTCLILQVPHSALDARKALTKVVKEQATIEECKTLESHNMRSWVNRQLGKHGITIDGNALEELLKRVETNTEVLVNETTKLILYAEEVERVDLETVKLVVTKNVEDNVYEITNKLLENNRAKALEIYNDLIMHSEDPLRILSILVNKYREILHTKTLLENNASKQQISDYFNATPGRTYYIMKNAQSVVKERVVDYLKTLEKIDYQIKTGQIDKKIALELFILGQV
ncbi:MAG: DNA polymerase III subunit delta [Candidatus Izemoplasma sp.]|nr:DNA polymerase III subunit delta [Candidatus Izemoplasma sp.]